MRCTPIFFGFLALATSCQQRPRQGLPSARSVASAPRLVLGPPVTTGHEFALAFGPGDRSVVISRRTFPSPTSAPVLHLLESRRTDTGWTTPAPLPFSGGVAKDIDPIWTPDQSALLFNSDRPARGRAPDATDFDIWIVRPTSTGWSTPERLPAPINSSRSEYYASITRDGMLYWTRSNDSLGTRWIMRSQALVSGEWSAPESLSVVNSTGNASNPFIAPDGSYLLFVDDRLQGAGSAGLWMSRSGIGGWAVPRALLIDSSHSQFAPSVSSDGRWLRFARLTRGRAGEAPITRDEVFEVPFAQVVPPTDR
jgi:hypothetical protein